ncbi:Gfo/Idh/MocA family oxidoreductase [Fulvivirgaceae bacterium BMA10]|uniref:Gfo/Idh/MocA family oxidoreductase n=1 Tax=Splendidivirga corallicola TaxID=3051826 RepID=A0ABT8KRQ9_9BACT|nr:Gfo/Idh/MocA family oxidoreductase [Fulvivirgaceae bacterium BMA10]
MKNHKVTWGIIGVGDVCEVKSAPAMNLVENSELIAVMRRRGALAKDYAQRHNIAKWYDDADELINDPDVNAIYIATPPAFHAEYTKRVASAGKAVYVEKPMARTYEECLEMIEACKNANVPLYVAYYRRSLPHFLKIKELIDQQAIGDIRMVNIQLIQACNPDIVSRQEHNWRVDPKIAGGGYFYDLASHQLDFLDYVLGPIETANGHATNQMGLYNAEDIVTASFRFESGVLGVGSWCFTSSEVSKNERTTIIGSKGQISYQSFGKAEVILETTKEERQIFTFDLPRHIQQPHIQSVVEAILGRGKCPSDGESASRTNLIMESIIGDLKKK